MSRALNQSVVFSYDLRASRNASRAESLPLKARTVRPPKGRTLEIKRTSIPRLKHDNRQPALGERWDLNLETKRTSITRLKLYANGCEDEYRQNSYP